MNEKEEAQELIDGIKECARRFEECYIDTSRPKLFVTPEIHKELFNDENKERVIECLSSLGMKEEDILISPAFILEGELPDGTKINSAICNFGTCDE